MNEGYGVQGVIIFVFLKNCYFFTISSCSLSGVLPYVIVRSKLIFSCAVMDSTYSILYADIVSLILSMCVEVFSFPVSIHFAYVVKTFSFE